MLDDDEINQDTPKSEGTNDENTHSGRQETYPQSQIVIFNEITDASCEKDNVLFSIRSYGQLPDADTSSSGRFTYVVSRYHEDFVWLHDVIAECEDYVGLMIPAIPDKPDFADVKAKLNKLMDLENSIDPERYKKMKCDVDEVYCSKYKKVINSHTNFLKCISDNTKFTHDQNVVIFLTFEGSLDIRGKNNREMISSFFRTLASGADKLLRIGQKETDDFFNQERQFFEEYSERVGESKRIAIELKNNMEETNSALMQSHAALDGLKTFEKDEFAQLVSGFATMFDEVRKIENRLIDNVDLKFSDTFRYLSKESNEALNLLQRRQHALQEFEHANQGLDKAHQKRRDISGAERLRESAREKFEQISDDGRSDLKNFALRRCKFMSSSLKEFVKTQAELTKEEADKLETLVTDIESLKVIG